MRKKIEKKLVWLAIGTLSQDEKLLIYEAQKSEPQLALETSLQRADVHEPFTVIKRGEKLFIINGNRRAHILTKLYGSEYQVPVWVIDEELSDDDVHWLILDLAQTRKKSYVDIINEYHLYDRLIPNNQGKKDSPGHRRELIAKHIGSSTSKLAKLLRIDDIHPSLLKATDDGVITLTQAEKKAKEIKKKREAEQKPPNDLPISEETSKEPARHRDRIVDLEALPTCCTACNRPLHLEWAEVPEIFNVGRSPENSQTDWIN